MKKSNYIILSLLLFVLVSCAQTNRSSRLLGSWDYTSQVSEQQAKIIAEHEQREKSAGQEFSNYQLEITGEQVFADGGKYKNSSLVHIQLSLLLVGAVQLNYKLQEEGNWSIEGDNIGMVPVSSEVQPADDVTRLFSLVNRNIQELLKSPEQGRTMRIVSFKKDMVQFEYDPEAKVLIDLNKKK